MNIVQLAPGRSPAAGQKPWPPGIGLLIPLLVSPGCSRAPSFDILGSLFPAWLVCLALGLVLAALTHFLFARARIPLAAPILTYPSLAVLFTFGLWLAWFR